MEEASVPLHLHPAYGDTPDAIAALIRSYQPRIPIRHWAPIEQFVKDTVIAARPETVDRAKRLLREATGFTHWAVGEIGCPMDSEIYEAPLIQQYCSTLSGQVKPATVEAGHAYLTDLQRRLQSSPDVTRSGTTNQKALAGVPFTATEFARIRSWMTSRNGHYRVNATAAVALSAGAGLVNEDIVRLTREDITDHGPDAGIEIGVGGRGPGRHRTTWCTGEWEDDLRWVLERIPESSRHVFFVDTDDRQPKHVGQFLNYYRSPHGLRITIRRLHTSWFVSHLNAGTPMNVLLAAAGHKTTGQSLIRYVPHMRTFDPATVADYLRQKGTAK